MRPDDRSATEVARTWLTALQDCVRAIDFARARPLFADDVVSFGTHATIVTGREALERDQWRQVWPRIRDFTFQLDQARCLGGGDGLVVVVPWDSLGRRSDGSSFVRPGRATVALAREDGRWVAVHTHFSLSPAPG